MGLLKFIFNHRSWRVSNAAKFGKIEHRFGRLIQIPVYVIIGASIQRQEWIILGFAITTWIFWFIYLSAHTIEKKLYGHFGPRG